MFVADTCQQPDDPWGGNQVCSNVYSPYFGCSISCTDSNERISRRHPNLYTCGPSGSWNPKDSKRFVPLQYPPCGRKYSNSSVNFILFHYHLVNKREASIIYWSLFKMNYLVLTFFLRELNRTIHLNLFFQRSKEMLKRN